MKVSVAAWLARLAEERSGRGVHIQKMKFVCAKHVHCRCWRERNRFPSRGEFCATFDSGAGDASDACVR